MEGDGDVMTIMVDDVAEDDGDDDDGDDDDNHTWTDMCHITV